MGPLLIDSFNKQLFAMALDLSVCLLTYSNKKQNNESHLFLQSEQTEASRRRLTKFMKTLNKLLSNICYC